MEETAERPKWLLELENRKRKPRLAHEAGAGAPCMVCSNACPGLDLHFWRKICKNCKCSRDDHDVDDDDFPQFDLLFGPSKKFKKKPILLRVNNEKHHDAESAFEWVPPDTTKELATDYMKALPLDKLPIKGSAGAALRRQLLQKQLPLHDIDHKVCDELSEQEKKQFEKYLENIKKYVGQGKVIKMLSARPFDRSLMTPANATDMQRFSPQHKPSTPANMIQLRTPSSFSPKVSYGKNFSDNQNTLDHTGGLEIGVDQDSNRNLPLSEKYNLINNPQNSETAKSEAVKSGIINKALPLKEHHSMNQHGHDTTSTVQDYNTEAALPLNPLKALIQGYNDNVKNPVSSLIQSQSIDEDAQIAESLLANALLPPSTIRANEIIGSTLDEKGLMYIREKLTNKYSTQENQTMHNSPGLCRELDMNDPQRRGNNNALKNAGVFPSVDKEKDRTSIIAAMKNPSGISTILDESGKSVGSGNTEYKPIKDEREVTKPISQLIQSLPLDSALANSLNGQEKHAYSNDGKLIACPGGLSHPLLGIKETMDRLPQVPFISGEQPESQNHVYKQKDLFSAYPSDTLLSTQTPCPANVDSQYPAKLSSSMVPTNIIHSEGLHNQIFPHEAIGTVNQIIQNVPNVDHLRGAMEELAIECTKPQKCHKCEEDIRIGDVVVITEKAKNAAWHPGCFVCSVCNELLVDLVYFNYKNKLYCGRDLATLLGIPRCFACDELIFVREYTVAEGHNYHVKHFCCWDCDVPLAGQQYITENDRPLCLPCYQKTYAKTCNACNTVIAADQQGVSVKDLDFHATEACFCCYGCKKNLLNSRMAVKEGRLFCSKECISKFLHS